MEDIKNVLTCFGLADSSDVFQISASVWGVGREYVLKRVKNRNDAYRNIQVSKYLRTEGIPAAETISSLTGEEIVEKNGFWYFLTRRLPGNHLGSIYEYDYREVSLHCGELLSKLHKALLHCQPQIDCWENSLSDEMNGWIRKYFVENPRRFVPHSQVEQLCGEIRNYRGVLPRQLIHRDVHLGNLLFENETITGYIDFDLCQINIRIFDICYFALSLLADAGGDAVKREQWFTVLEGILEGYSSVSPLILAERQAIICVMKCIELMFVAHFFQNGQENSARNAVEIYHWLCGQEERLSHTVMFSQK